MCLINVKFDELNAYTNIYLLTKGFGIVFNFVFVVTAFINSFASFTEFLNEVIERRESYNLDHDANGQRHSGKMLEITSINRSQAGEYKCEASNECGNATKTARIHVQLKLPGTRNLSIVQYILYLYSNGFIVSYHINESVLEIILFAMFFMMAMAIFLPRDNSSLCDSTLICYWYALARFYWFISILIIIRTIRCYSLIGRLCN